MGMYDFITVPYTPVEVRRQEMQDRVALKLAAKAEQFAKALEARTPKPNPGNEAKDRTDWATVAPQDVPDSLKAWHAHRTSPEMLAQEAKGKEAIRKFQAWYTHMVEIGVLSLPSGHGVPGRYPLPGTTLANEKAAAEAAAAAQASATTAEDSSAA